MDIFCRFGNYDKVYIVLKNYIKEGKSIKEIAAILDEREDFLVSLLLDYDKDLDKKEILKTVKDYYDNIKITEERILLISDQHLGGEYGDKNYLEIAYNYALKRNIKYIINGGDIIEGNSNQSVRRLKTDEQLDYIKEIYPSNLGIETLYIYGNHDYNIEYFEGKSLREKLKDKNDMTYIGVKHTFIDINGRKIKLSHESEKCYYKLPEYEKELEILGHSHEFVYIEEKNKLYLPTLSNDFKVSNVKPGFIELIVDEYGFIIRPIEIENYGISLKKEKVLEKKI